MRVTPVRLGDGRPLRLYTARGESSAGWVRAGASSERLRLDDPASQGALNRPDAHPRHHPRGSAGPAVCDGRRTWRAADVAGRLDAQVPTVARAARSRTPSEGRARALRVREP